MMYVARQPLLRCVMIGVNSPVKFFMSALLLLSGGWGWGDKYWKYLWVLLMIPLQYQFNGPSHIKDLLEYFVTMAEKLQCIEIYLDETFYNLGFPKAWHLNSQQASSPAGIWHWRIAPCLLGLPGVHTMNWILHWCSEYSNLIWWIFLWSYRYPDNSFVSMYAEWPVWGISKFSSSPSSSLYITTFRSFYCDPL